MTVTQDRDVRAGDGETSQLLSEQEQQWVDTFMDETTLFLGPDPRDHAPPRDHAADRV